jgi:hypothetical protein
VSNTSMLINFYNNRAARLSFSGMLCVAGWQLFTCVLGQSMRRIFEGQAVNFFENGTNRLSLFVQFSHLNDAYLLSSYV